MSSAVAFLCLLTVSAILVTECIAQGGRGGDVGGGPQWWGPAGTGLRPNFYQRTCPRAEDIVRRITWANVAANPALAAKFIRLQNHDCFQRGCDASILLDPVPGSTTLVEKQVEPNLSLTGYEVVDEIKHELEKACPETVSCADIIALAARDAVSYQFGFPLWQVDTGRRDGIVSLASEVPGNFPNPFDNFIVLQQLFAKKGLNVADLVALSGAHTLGISHCTFFAKRLNFTGVGDVDPLLDPRYADRLRQLCPSPFNPATTVDLDFRSPLTFDTSYFSALTRNMGLLHSDAALLTDPAGAAAVRRMLNPAAFFDQFGRSMRKMGAFEVLTGTQGQIRRHCRAVNVR